MKEDLVSIIIVNYNGRDLLKMIIDSIKKSNYKKFEIMVVDNNSNDGSQKFIKEKYKDVRLVLNQKNLGYSGINSALRHCRGNYILFLNNDMEMDKNCISQLVKTISSNENTAMVAPKLVNFYDRSLKSGGTWVSRAFYNGHIKGNGKNIANEIPYLGVGLIKKDFVNMFGYLFDPDYFIYAEDLDLGLRIRLSGKKLLFEPNAILYHMHSLTTQKTSKAFTTFLMERNLLTTFLKIFSAKNVILYIPYVIFARCVAILKDLTTMRAGIAFSRIKAILFVIFNMPLILEKRRQTQKFRKASDSYILKVFNESHLFRQKFVV